MATKKETKIIAEAGKQELFIVREFNAPRELVFEAFSDPELLMQWLGPKDMKMNIDYYEVKSGGKYRYTHIDAKGNEYAFNGVIHEVTAPERMIQTFEFEGMPTRGHVSMDTALFEELPGENTRLTIQSVFRSVTDRDGIVASGMKRGIDEGFEKLEQLLINRKH